MNNREKLKKLIETLAGCSYSTGNADSRSGPTPVRYAIAEAAAKQKIDDFIASLNLDPVLETWEQAAKREGWVRGKKSEAPTLYADSVLFKNGVQRMAIYSYDNPWAGLCHEMKIDKKIIDASKETT